MEDSVNQTASKERRQMQRQRYAALTRCGADSRRKGVDSRRGCANPSVNSPPEIGWTTTKMWRLRTAKWAPIRRSIHRRKSTSFRQLRFERVPPPPPPLPHRPSQATATISLEFSETASIRMFMHPEYPPQCGKQTHNDFRVAMATWTEFTHDM